MAPISFARGAPSPECLDVELIEDCSRAVLERDGKTILAYGAGGGYGPLRELLAERHGVEPECVFVTTGGLQGFVFYAEAQLQRRAYHQAQSRRVSRKAEKAARQARLALARAI